MVLGIELRLFFNAISYSFIKHVVINVQGIGSEMSNIHVGVFSFSTVENRSSGTVRLVSLQRGSSIPSLAHCPAGARFEMSCQGQDQPHDRLQVAFHDI